MLDFKPECSLKCHSRAQASIAKKVPSHLRRIWLRTTIGTVHTASITYGFGEQNRSLKSPSTCSRHSGGRSMPIKLSKNRGGRVIGSSRNGPAPPIPHAWHG